MLTNTQRWRGFIVGFAVASAFVVPSAAFADANSSLEYSGVADATGATGCWLDDVTGEEICATVNENIAATNSTGNIVPDQPGTPQDETEDTVVATTTPIRVETPDGEGGGTAGAVGASAPTDVDTGQIGGQTYTVGDGNGNVAASTEGTGSILDVHASTNESTVWGFSHGLGEDVTVGTSQNRVVLPSVHTDAWIDRWPDGTIMGTSEVTIDSDGAQPISLFNGFITADQVWAWSQSGADGVFSFNDIEFSVTNLALRDAEWGNILILINQADNLLNEGTTVLNATINGVFGTVTTPSGSDLLDRNTYADDPNLFAAYLAILPQLNNLTGIGGALEGLSLILGGGWSDDGNGDYARGMMQAVRAATTDSEFVLGYAYTGVDAVRTFSTATDPSWPAWVTPVSDAERAFPQVRHAAEWVGRWIARGPNGHEHVAGHDHLPHTGLGLAMIALLGFAALIGGAATRRVRVVA